MLLGDSGGGSGALLGAGRAIQPISATVVLEDIAQPNLTQSLDGLIDASCARIPYAALAWPAGLEHFGHRQRYAAPFGVMRDERREDPTKHGSARQITVMGCHFKPASVDGDANQAARSLSEEMGSGFDGRWAGRLAPFGAGSLLEFSLLGCRR